MARQTRTDKDKTLRHLYGISLKEYEDRVSEQGGVCKICEKPPPHNQILYVDHCHLSGKVRGLLCPQCNFGLGAFRDSPYLLSKAMRYIKESE